MADNTNAERQRRFKARQRYMKDPLRAFLTYVVAAADASMKAGKAEAWHRGTAGTATRLLGLLDGPTDTQDAGAVSRIVIYFGGQAVEGVEGIVQQWIAERWAEHRSRVTGVSVTTVLSPEAEEAMKTLEWAEDLRVKDQWTSPVVREGLRAVTTIIRERDSAVSTEEYAEWLAAIGTIAMQRYFDNGCQPITPTEYAWA